MSRTHSPAMLRCRLGGLVNHHLTIQVFSRYAKVRCGRSARERREEKPSSASRSSLRKSFPSTSPGICLKLSGSLVSVWTALTRTGLEHDKRPGLLLTEQSDSG